MLAGLVIVLNFSANDLDDGAFAALSWDNKELVGANPLWPGWPHRFPGFGPAVLRLCLRLDRAVCRDLQTSNDVASQFARYVIDGREFPILLVLDLEPAVVDRPEMDLVSSIVKSTFDDQIHQTDDWCICLCCFLDQRCYWFFAHISPFLNVSVRVLSLIPC